MSEVAIDPKRDRLVITASALGTIFEWYDFFVYGILAVLIGKLFFPSDNEAAATLASLAAFGAGFGVRPLGALVFGYLGDRIGRKYTFLITITLMGGATAAIGFLPTYAQAGLWAAGLLVFLRCLQGLALGGEYGGAAIYVAEHAPKGKRGQYTSWIQASVAGGFLLAVCVVLATRSAMSTEAFEAWGWRIPFLISILLLAISLWIRLMLNESPVFKAMKEAGTVSKNPFIDSIKYPGNVKRILIAMFGVAAGLTVIYYTSQFYTLYFLTGTARVPETDALGYMAVGALLAAPLYVAAGWLSDHYGRKRILLTGYALSMLLTFPLFWTMADAANPALSKATAANPAAKWEAIVRDSLTIIIDVDFGTTAFGQPYPSANTIGVTSQSSLSVRNALGAVRESLIDLAKTSPQTAAFTALPTTTLPTSSIRLRSMLRTAIFAASVSARAGAPRRLPGRLRTGQPAPNNMDHRRVVHSRIIADARRDCLARAARIQSPIVPTRHERFFASISDLSAMRRGAVAGGRPSRGRGDPPRRAGVRGLRAELPDRGRHSAVRRSVRRRDAARDGREFRRAVAGIRPCRRAPRPAVSRLDRARDAGLSA